jgi:hypothetical protein
LSDLEVAAAQTQQGPKNRWKVHAFAGPSLSAILVSLLPGDSEIKGRPQIRADEGMAGSVPEVGSAAFGLAGHGLASA